MADVFNDLAKKTGLNASQAADALKSDEAKKIAADLGKKVGLKEDKTKEILDTASGAINDDVLSKIKKPFG